MSRHVRTLLQGVISVAREVALHGELADQSQAAKKFALLRSFPFAVQNSEWTGGLLPLVILLSYMPRDCNNSVRSDCNMLAWRVLVNTRCTNAGLSACKHFCHPSRQAGPSSQCFACNK